MVYRKLRYSPNDDSTCTSLPTTGTMNDLYKHITRPIMFILVVDDFGIKSHGQQHLDHLLHTLRHLYTIKTGDGSKYLGMSLEWDYN